MGEHKTPWPMEDRTEEFARRVRAFVRRLPRTVSNVEDVKQLVRSSGSVASNYIEAAEPLGPKDRVSRLKTSRKEAKESRLWLRLVHTRQDRELESERAALVGEATELLKILSRMIDNSS